MHTDHHVKFDFVVVEIRKVFAQVESQAGGAQNRARGRQGNRLALGDHADTLQTLTPDWLASHQHFVFRQSIGQHVEQRQHVIAPTSGQVCCDTARADEVVVHPQTSDFLEEPQYLLALAPAVKHHRDSAEVHAIRRHEQQVATHAIEFRQQHAHPLRSFWNVTINAKQFFGG